MNRIIRFRAWHSRQHKMFSAEEMGADELTLNPDGRGFVNVSSTSARLSQYIPEMLPLQFTGLLDKNGREIYEGDILRNVNVDGFFSGPEVFAVEWDKGYFRYFAGFKASEVIGNIYENPAILPSANTNQATPVNEKGDQSR